MTRASFLLLLTILALPLPGAAQRVTGVSPARVALEAGGRPVQIQVTGSDLERASGARVTLNGRVARGMATRLSFSRTGATIQITTGTPTSSSAVTLTATAYGVEGTTVLTVEGAG
ncbi:MAG: hypothetical protein WD960_12730 [Gemmatimonadota bacterium]